MKAGCDTCVCNGSTRTRGRMLREVKVNFSHKVSLRPVGPGSKKPKRTKYNTNHVISSRGQSTGISLQRQLSNGLVAHRYNPSTKRPRTAV